MAATGLALACYPVSVERGFMSRAAAVERTLATLRFFWNSPQGPEPDATGYKGFYYHFLDMQTGRRVWQCELSTVDSAFLLAGALTVGIYFDADTAEEREIRTLGDALYRRADWQWAQNQGATVTHGWKPESGFPRLIVGKATTRLCCYKCWGWGHRLIQCPRVAVLRGPPLVGRGTLLWAGIYLRWVVIYPSSFRMSGSISVEFRMRTCVRKASTISRTAAARRMHNNRRPSTIHSSSKDYGRLLLGMTASEGPGPDDWHRWH